MRTFWGNSRNTYGLVLTICLFIALSVFLTVGHTLLKTQKISEEANKKLLLSIARNVDDTIKLHFTTPLTYAKAVVASPFLSELIDKEEVLGDKEYTLSGIKAMLVPMQEDFNFTNINIITDKMKNFYSSKGVARAANEYELHVYKHFLETNKQGDVKFAFNIAKDPLNDDKWTLFTNISIKNDKKEDIGVASFGMDAQYVSMIIKNIEDKLNSEHDGDETERLSFKVRFVNHAGNTQIDANSVSIDESTMPAAFDESARFEVAKDMLIASKPMTEFGWRLEVSMSSNVSKAFRLLIEDNLMTTLVILLVFVVLSSLLIHKKQKQLIKLSWQDGLTGVLNREGGEVRIKEMLEKHEKGVFCLLDADRFKYINDTFGHGVGDEVIIFVAKSLQKIARSSDVIFRLGGDEFGIFASGLSDMTHTRTLINRLFDEISSADIAGLKGYKFSISAGASFYSKNESFAELYEKADKALYEAKKHQGNALSFL